MFSRHYILGELFDDESLRKLRVGGGKLFLVAPQPRVRSVLEIARLDSIFKIVATEADALK